MNRYRLDARRFAGSLRAPRRNDSRSVDSDDPVAVQELATELVARGFTVWIYERVAARVTGRPATVDLRPPAAWELRLVEQRSPAEPPR